MQNQKPFELVFIGIPVDQGCREIDVVEEHATFDEAEKEAYRVHQLNPMREAHPALIFGPGCPQDGFMVH